MRISEIKDIEKIQYVVNILFGIPTIKALDLRKIDKEKGVTVTMNKLYNYIHLDIDIFDLIDVQLSNSLNYDPKIIVMYSCTHINDKINDQKNDEYVEHFGINPDAIIQGPIKYKEIKEFYKYIGGPNTLILDEEDVYFCFGDKLKMILETKYKELINEK